MSLIDLIKSTESDSPIHSEVREYLERRSARHQVLPRAALVGLLAGAIAVAFRSLLAVADLGRDRLITWAHQFHLFGWLFPVLFSAVGAGLALYLVRTFAPEASGSGIPHLEAVLRRYKELRWKPVLLTKFVSGVLAIGSGLVLGREGPTVQMGGAVGEGVGRFFRVGTGERLILVAAGAGAGLAAAFNAPLAGLVFVVEELQRDFRPGVFGAAFVSAALADVVSRLFSGQLPVFTAPAYPAPALAFLPVFGLLGVMAGFLGVAFNRGLVGSLDLFSRVPSRWRVPAACAVGGLVGLVAYLHPNMVGSGHELSEEALAGRIALILLPAVFLLRFVLTLGSYGSGVAGGIFAPLLALGAVLGLSIGQLMQLLAPHANVMPGAFAVVGMAAYFTAIVRAPLTGIVLIVEMTSSYALSLPLLVGCFCAYGTAEALRDLPIYEALLQRDLSRSPDSDAHSLESESESIVIELEIEPYASFAGKRVRDLGLPPGVILANLRDGHHELAPTADTVLHDHMRVTAIVYPGSEDGLKALREGCARSE